jgi:hypothetical protein
MTSDEKEKRVSASGKVIGRPEKPEAERLSVRIVVKVTPEMAAAAEKRAEMLSNPAAVATPASWIRMLMDEDLRAHGLLVGTSPATAPVTLPELVEAPAVAATAPESRPFPLPASPPAPPQERAVEPLPSASKAAAKDKPLTPASVRKRMERAYAAELTRDELAERSGIPRDKLSHFRNESPDRGKLSEEKLRALDGALERWEQEQERAS